MRLVGYIRVSSVAGRDANEERFISPQVQREQIAALAKARGHEVIEWIEDLDESGGKWNRPGFQRALAMVERGEVQGIGVAKLDRFARSVSDGLKAIERINEARGELISVAENFDTTTPMGRAMLQISLVFAELERERQRESFAVAKRRAIDRGMHYSPTVPVGYTRGDDMILVPDPVAAPVIREVFRKRAAGEKWQAIASYLDRVMPRPDGGAWPINTLSNLVRNRVYLGEAHQGDVVNRGAHIPIVTRAEWEGAQPSAANPRRQTRSGMLIGLLECENCGRPMFVMSNHSYGCRARRASGLCDRPAWVTRSKADAYVEQVFRATHPRVVAVERGVVVNIGDIEARLDAADADIAAYRDMGADYIEAIGRESYFEGLRKRAAVREGVLAELATAQARNEVNGHTHDVLSEFGTMAPHEQATVLSSLIEKIVVTPVDSRIDAFRVPVEERLTIVWHEGVIDSLEEHAGTPSTKNL